jgi:cellulose biosynthesis protein BcsQ
MNSIVSLPQIENFLTNELQTHDPEVKVRIRRTTLGWIKIQVITSFFEGNTTENREEKIDKILKKIDINLSQYPIAGYEFLTPQEVNEQQPEYIQLPLWSDILMASDPDKPIQIEEDSPKHPLVVTFYSFKGGVGRSTALGLVAGILASRNRRIVMVDFDLEAPGISVLFRSDVENFNQEQFGVVDYVYQRYLTPDENFPSIEDCIFQVNLSTRGELFLVPVGEYDENYIHRLAELDRRTLQQFYTSTANPIRQLIEDIKKQLNPDVILIDARPGFNDTNAIALFDLADTAIICFSPTDQSFEGLRWVVRAAGKQRDYQGKPDLRFLLTPMPLVAAEQRQIWISKVEKWLEENWILPSGITVNEVYYEVPYNPNITTLYSLINEVPPSLLNDYLPLADAIDASLPDIQPNVATTIVKNPDTILNELRFEAARAQDLEADSIPNIFQSTEDFPQFLKNRTWLIRGAKGTGKSLLFRLFVEQPEKAKDLARLNIDLSNVNFIPGHGEVRLLGPILESRDLENYERQVGENSWAIFWLNYALLQLCHSIPELQLLSNLDEQLIALSSQDNPSHTSIVYWLVERTQSPQAASKAIDELRAIDNWLQTNNLRAWLLYDELDAGFGSSQQDYIRRRRALDALLAWWLESGTSLKSIVPKIFLREDIWEHLNFTNKGHYVGRSVQLRWGEVDLWRLVLRQVLNSSDTLSRSLEQNLGVTIARLNTIELEQLRRSLYPLWGERMGRTKKAYTYNWIRTRIADGQKNCFPRSLILLLKEAVKREKAFSTEYNPEVLLRPKALIDAFPYVSEQRVDEVRNEYPELEEYLSRLQGERSPIDSNRLAEIWNITDSALALRVKDMVDAGIFTERSRPQDPPPRVYAIAELYLYGLKMVRKGQR